MRAKSFMKPKRAEHGVNAANALGSLVKVKGRSLVALTTVAILTALTFLSACSTLFGALFGSKAPDEPCQTLPLEVFLNGDAMLNLNPAGQPMPVQASILLLADRAELDRSSFERLWPDPAAVLGKDFIEARTVTVFPGEDRIEPIDADPKTAFVAIVAAFRRIEGKGWRHVVDIRQEARECRPGGLHIVVHAALQDNRVIARSKSESVSQP